MIHLSNPSPTKKGRIIQIQPILRSPVVANPAQTMQFGAIRARIPKRPVDKQLVAITKTTLDGTQENTTLITVTFPCTIVGIRWNISVVQDAGTGNATCAWCINVLRDGGTQKVMSLTDGSTFFAPESDCLSFGIATIDNNVSSSNYEGSTKTMRKMMGGDKLIFSAVGTATNTSALRGIIQFFCKT